MNLITTDNLSNELRAQFIEASSIKIMTGYLTLSGAEFLLNSITDDTRVQLVVRARPQDLLSGATDLEAIKLLFNNGVRCHIHRTLHAKLYVIDNKDAFIGSANFTSNGLKLSGYGNFELSTKTTLTDKDNGLIREVFDDSIMVTKRVVKTLEEFISSSSVTPDLASFNNKGWWDELVAPEVQINHDKLYISDLPWINLEQDTSTIDKSSENFLHDSDVFGLRISADLGVKSNFKSSKIFKFLLETLRGKESSEIYFGELTSKIHDALVDEPLPYRSDIKQLVRNLIIYIVFFSNDVLSIDSPRYSSRIRFT